MARTPTKNDKKTREHRELKKAAGSYVAGLRIASGLTQVKLADNLELEFHTFISQVETGMRKIPPNEMERWARELKVDVQTFARHLFKFYEPDLYRLVFRKETGV